jgi:hypothetical protein
MVSNMQHSSHDATVELIKAEILYLTANNNNNNNNNNNLY